MTYESVDALQRALAKGMFGYAADAKKAAGRALGTLVEIITFYFLKGWGFERFCAIERRVPEYANPDMTHNVEFSLHPSELLASFDISRSRLPLSCGKLLTYAGLNGTPGASTKTTQLLSTDGILRNACVLREEATSMAVAYLDEVKEQDFTVCVHRLHAHPFAVFECKRVGVEEGVKKRIVQGWFNVISPANRQLTQLRDQMMLLAHKNW